MVYGLPHGVQDVVGARGFFLAEVFEDLDRALDISSEVRGV